jgi:hypothetical protein
MGQTSARFATSVGRCWCGTTGGSVPSSTPIAKIPECAVLVEDISALGSDAGEGVGGSMVGVGALVGGGEHEGWGIVKESGIPVGGG